MSRATSNTNHVQQETSSPEKSSSDATIQELWNRVHRLESTGNSAKRSRLNSDSSVTSDRVAELEEELSVASNQVLKLHGLLRDKTLELSVTSERVDTLTNSLNEALAKCVDLECKLEEANRLSSSQEIQIQLLEKETEQFMVKMDELEKSAETSGSSDLEQEKAKNLNLQSDIEKQTTLIKNLSSKLAASRENCSKLNERVKSLAADRNKPQNPTKDLSKLLAKANEDIEMFTSERDVHVAKIKFLEKYNNQLRTQLEERKNSSAVVKPTVAVSDVQMVNPVQDSQLARPKPSFDIIRELFTNRCITNEMFAAAINSNLTFEKFYPNCSDLTMMKRTYDTLATALRKLRKVSPVLVLIECPFVVLCLRTFGDSDCKLVIKKKVKEELALHESKFGVYEELDKRANRETFDLVLSDQEYLDEDVRFVYMMVKGRAFNCVTGERTYLRRNSSIHIK